MNGHDRPLTPEQIGTVKDGDIDFGDIPELDETFWREAELVEPDRTEQITIRVKRSVLDHFRAPGRGYQSRIDRPSCSGWKAVCRALQPRDGPGDSSTGARGEPLQSQLGSVRRSARRTHLDLIRVEPPRLRSSGGVISSAMAVETRVGLADQPPVEPSFAAARLVARR